jgi:hypothetical protein
MSYWNRENFEGLAGLAVELREADPLLEPLARYCELREEGRRKEAFASLEAFLAAAESLDAGTRRRLVLHVLRAHHRTPDAHQFLARPLRSRFVVPVLEGWRAEEPGEATPLRELALLDGRRDLLEEALRLDPADDRVRREIVAQLLSFVDHATHHLVESHFIGEEQEAVSALDEAGELLAQARDAGVVESERGKLEALRGLVEDWVAYRKDPEGTFPEWCARRGRTHPWTTIVYYDS